MEAFLTSHETLGRSQAISTLSLNTAVLRASVSWASWDCHVGCAVPPSGSVRSCCVVMLVLVA